MQNNFDFSKESTQHIIDALQISFLQSVDGGFQFHNDRAPYRLQELHTFFHPYISNDMYEREKQVVRRENLRTLKILARVEVPDSLFEELVEELQFKIVYDKNQL